MRYLSIAEVLDLHERLLATSGGASGVRDRASSCIACRTAGSASPNFDTRYFWTLAGITGFWRQYVGLEGETVGIDGFGESAPAATLYDYFGLTAENVAMAAKRALTRNAGITRAAARAPAVANA